MKISAVVHTYNSSETLEKALQSISWADEIIVVDMQSTDRSVEIARNFTDRIFSVVRTPRVDGIRNEYNAKANHEWLFVLDSDEYLAADAKNEMAALIEKYGMQYDAFAIPRFNYIAGQIMRGSGWYPDHQIRLFRKGAVRWIDGIHVPPEIISGKYRLYELVPPECMHIHHYNYRDLRHFIQKQVEYALHDSYGNNAEGFDFGAYIQAARDQLATRRDPQQDGDLSSALSLLSAWDCIVRGLIHWDSLTPRPPLGEDALLPNTSKPATTAKMTWKKWLARHYSFHFTARNLRNRLLALFAKGRTS